MKLIKPHPQYEKSFREGFEELDNDSDRNALVYLGPDYPDYFKVSFDEYVKRLVSFETAPPSHFVCGSTYWAIKESEVVGRIGLQHELNEFLETLGGHVGYIVRPSWRRKGIATNMLKQVLDTDIAKSIGKLLLTCDEGNIASEKTILACGGQLQDVFAYDPVKPRKKRYWINLN